MISTKTFGGGKWLDDVIQGAMKACGKSSLIEPPPPVSTAAEPGSPEWGRASAACPRPYNFVADKDDKWTCVNDQSGVPVRETAPLPAPPRVGKDCSGIPMEKRTLDCAPAAATAPNSEAAPAPPSGSWASRPDVTPADKEAVLERARSEIPLGRPREPIVERLRQLGLNPADAAPTGSQAVATGGVCDTFDAVQGTIRDAVNRTLAQDKLALEVTGLRVVGELSPSECTVEATTSTGHAIQFNYTRNGDGNVDVQVRLTSADLR